MHKWFGDKHVLRGVSFSIRRGEAVGVIGSSGTGKVGFGSVVPRHPPKGDIEYASTVARSFQDPKVVAAALEAAGPPPLRSFTIRGPR